MCCCIYVHARHQVISCTHHGNLPYMACEIQNMYTCGAAHLWECHRHHGHVAMRVYTHMWEYHVAMDISYIRTHRVSGSLAVSRCGV